MKKINNPAEDDPKQQAYFQAAKWYIQMQEAYWDAEQQLQFEQWLVLSPLHQEVWQSVNMFDQKLGRVPKGITAKTLQQLQPKPCYTTKFSLMLFAVGMTLYGIQGIRQQDYLPELFNFETIEIYKTQIGEQQYVTLIDGSQVWLNSQSKIRVKYDTKQRRIELTRGEIYIETHKDESKRPFSVNTQHGDLLALGTIFNVRYLTKKTELIVKQGIVRIQQDSKQYQDISAQHTVRFDQNQIYPEPYTSLPLLWRQQLLVINSMPLEQFINELSRYHNRDIRIDPSLEKVLISGAYSTQDLSRTLNMLQTTYHFKVVHNHQNLITLQP